MFAAAEKTMPGSGRARVRIGGARARAATRAGWRSFIYKPEGIRQTLSVRRCPNTVRKAYNGAEIETESPHYRKTQPACVFIHISHRHMRAEFPVLPVLALHIR